MVRSTVHGWGASARSSADSQQAQACCEPVSPQRTRDPRYTMLSDGVAGKATGGEGARALLVNFVTMSVLFSINHGTVR
jgi:hypothetical protein